MSKQIISTNQAPAAIGTYSQATRHGVPDEREPNGLPVLDERVQ